MTKKPNKQNDNKFSRAAMIAYFLKGSTRFFVISVLSSFILSVLQMITPRIVSVTVDSIIGDRPPEYAKIVDMLGDTDYLKENIWIIAILSAIVGIAVTVFRYLSGYFNSKGAESLIKNIRDLLFKKVLHLPLSWHMKNRTGDIIQRCTTDTETIRSFIADQLTRLLNILILIGVSLFCVFSIHKRLALLTLLTIPIVVSYSYVFYKKSSKLFTECDESEGVLSSIAQENLTGSRVVKAFGREVYEKAKFEAQNEDYTSKWIHLCRLLSVYWGTTDFVAGAQIMLVLVIGTAACLNQSLTPGNLISFISYNTMLIWPVRQLGRMISDMSKAGVAVDRIRYIMNSESEQDTGKRLAFEPGDIEFKNVSFAYENTEVLKDISFKVKKGEILGIIGATGSGKTTIMLLLTRLCRPQNGKITINGIDIEDIDLGELRKNIGTVMQEPFLFSGTLAENIAITSKEQDMDKIRTAAAISCLEKTIDNFKEGYSTVVGERGITLSGGQKQRTAIARVLMLNSPVIVLDDSLSAVDTETDAKIRSNLSKNFNNATVFLISHRLTSLMKADKIIVLSNGKIIEKGSPDELLKSDGEFSKIYHMQMTLPEELSEVHNDKN